MSSSIKHKSYALSQIKCGLLLFWGCWFLLAFLTNCSDFFGTYNLLPADWRFRSGNMALILSAIHIYGFSYALANLLFFIDIIIQGSVAGLFLIATIKFWTRRPAWKWINAAFGISIALWAAFTLMDEFFIVYNLEGTHMSLFAAELLTMIAMHLLPAE